MIADMIELGLHVVVLTLQSTINRLIVIHEVRGAPGRLDVGPGEQPALSIQCEHGTEPVSLVQHCVWVVEEKLVAELRA